MLTRRGRPGLGRVKRKSNPACAPGDPAKGVGRSVFACRKLLSIKFLFRRLRDTSFVDSCPRNVTLPCHVQHCSCEVVKRDEQVSDILWLRRSRLPQIHRIAKRIAADFYFEFSRFVLHQSVARESRTRHGFVCGIARRLRGSRIQAPKKEFWELEPYKDAYGSPRANKARVVKRFVIGANGKKKECLDFPLVVFQFLSQQNSS